MDPTSTECPEVSAIAACAKTVRTYLESPSAGQHVELFKRFPAGACLAASGLLNRFLRERLGLQGIRGVRNGERRQGKVRQSHFWLEFGPWIIDITADQFDDHPRQASVVVSCDRSWHEQFVGSDAYDMPPSHDLYEFEPEYQSFLSWVAARPSIGSATP